MTDQARDPRSKALPVDEKTIIKQFKKKEQELTPKVELKITPSFCGKVFSPEEKANQLEEAKALLVTLKDAQSQRDRKEAASRLAELQIENPKVHEMLKQELKEVNAKLEERRSKPADTTINTPSTERDFQLSLVHILSQMPVRCSGADTMSNICAALTEATGLKFEVKQPNEVRDTVRALPSGNFYLPGLVSNLGAQHGYESQQNATGWKFEYLQDLEVQMAGIINKAIKNPKFNLNNIQFPPIPNNNLGGPPKAPEKEIKEKENDKASKGGNESEKTEPVPTVKNPDTAPPEPDTAQRDGS